ncbi:MAG TPA: malto-oligosyltrehalose trehalohydrolase [Rhodocyclaceae bacterium]|nr:malto-oligosyltrehalose trehalohydrolase [Rhodocyclaceae bacterium]
MIRHHPLPFGAEIQPAGGVRFRLWAPSADKVELCIQSIQSADTASADYPMAAHSRGWHECTVPEAKAGTRYRFRINGELLVPDPASRFNPDDVHGSSEVIDPSAFDWQDADWRGRLWEHAVIYELHLGCFTPEGTLKAAEQKLPYLAELGITAVELMPVADFSGRRNWGYDGALPFAPDSRYGRPEDLKRFVQAAHGLGLMVLLDVVYNHFGPDGNYLHAYAAPFFIDHPSQLSTPWGAAIDFSCEKVRDFTLHNALYWLEEYHVDGLRLDAVHAIHDDSPLHVVKELAVVIHAAFRDRQVHLILENDNNQSRFLDREESGKPHYATAQWNDDIHHVMHVLLTGETDGYYRDYARHAAERLGRCLTEGFDYQGEPSPYRHKATRGEPSAHLPSAAFIAFLQNHDQIGNRAFGERIGQLAAPRALEAAHAVLLLSPQVPLLFMGEEFAAAQPFLYFCDYTEQAPDLAASITAGRREGFARFTRFADPVLRDHIPDPNAEFTFRASKLDWSVLNQPNHARALAHHRHLLQIRHDRLVPRLAGTRGTGYAVHGPHALGATWRLGDGSSLYLAANLGAEDVSNVPMVRAELIYRSEHLRDEDLRQGRLSAWSVAWWVQEV